MAFQKATEMFTVYVEGKKEKYLTHCPLQLHHYVHVLLYYCIIAFWRKRDPFAGGDDDEEEEEERPDETFAAFALTLCRNVTATTASIIAGHPFQLIAIRTMAQFVGEEQKYT